MKFQGRLQFYIGKWGQISSNFCSPVSLIFPRCRFTPSVNAIIYHGDKKQRDEIRRKHMPSSVGPSFPIVVTSYFHSSILFIGSSEPGSLAVGMELFLFYVMTTGIKYPRLSCQPSAFASFAQGLPSLQDLRFGEGSQSYFNVDWTFFLRRLLSFHSISSAILDVSKIHITSSRLSSIDRRHYECN